MGKPPRVIIICTFVLLTLIWGTTWAAIRVGLGGIGPITGVALRFAIASLLLLAMVPLLKVRLGRLPGERRLWLLNAACSFCVSYGIVYWAEQWLPSGLTSVIFATLPLFVALMAHAALPGEQLTRVSLIGVITGFAGVAVIFSEDFSALAGPGAGRASVVLLISPLLSAVASVAIRKWGRAIHPISISAVPMGIAAGVMGALAFALERDTPPVFDAVSVGALLYLAVVGSAVTFSLYFWLLAHVEATKMSLIAYTAPVVAVCVGALAFDEPMTRKILTGSAMVIGGVALAVHRRRPRERIRPAEEADHRRR
jgi:drug/metabolite transporter (DMT)-like permease